ncbi:MAG TPA: DNA repair protein RecN [Trueperaceae bacterium]
MLSALELKDFAIVDELRLELAPGLNALTGETGAGKSILVDALTLLVGARADTGMIRAGCTAALVQGFFRGEGSGAGEISASRRVQAEGRSHARIDGELVTVSELGERIGSLVAIHGQHAAQALAQAEEPRRRVDRLVDDAARESLARYRAAFLEHQRGNARLAELRESSRERERRQGSLRYEIDEIDAAQLRPGEEAILRGRAESLRHAERIVQNAASAHSLVSDGERSAVALLANAARDLANAARHHAALAPLAAELEEARASLQATGDEIESFLADFEMDPAELDRVEARLARIEALERKYGDTVEAVLAYRNEAAAQLERLEGAEFDADELERRLASLRSELDDLGKTVGRARERAGDELAKRVSELLGQLGMTGARFEVRLERSPEPGPYGLEKVRFDFSANPGEPLADLAAVGSGGELSRVMLALDVVTGSDKPVLVFDEVDAGIGGKTARAVGSLLRQLSRDHQVLVVTHLPQVAAFADAQYFVEKQGKEGRTVTRVHQLEPHEREQEIARMLSGDVTEASLRNARELVAQSRSG